MVEGGVVVVEDARDEVVVGMGRVGGGSREGGSVLKATERWEVAKVEEVRMGWCTQGLLKVGVKARSGTTRREWIHRAPGSSSSNTQLPPRSTHHHYFIMHVFIQTDSNNRWMDADAN